MKPGAKRRSLAEERLTDRATGAVRVHRWLDGDRSWLLDQLMRGDVPLPGGHCRAPLTPLEQRLILAYLSSGEAPAGWRAALLDAIALEIKRVQEHHGLSPGGDAPRSEADRRRYRAAVEALRAELAAAALEARRTGWQQLLDELRSGLLRLNGLRDRLQAEEHSAFGADPVLLRLARVSDARGRRARWLRVLFLRAATVAGVVVLIAAALHAYREIDELVGAGASGHRARVEQSVELESEPGPVEGGEGAAVTIRHRAR